MVQVISKILQEAEESRLWYQWIFEQSQTSACNDLGKALERYQFNNELLTTLMDGAGLAENQQGLGFTVGYVVLYRRSVVFPHMGCL